MTDEKIGLTPSSRSVEDILADLDLWTGKTKRELVYEACERKDEIVPHLLSHLKEILADPDAYLDEGRDLLPYALILLAYFQEQRSHALILDLYRKPGDLLHELIGGMRTDALSLLLIRTGGGSLEGMKELILDRQCYEYVRWASMEGLTEAVAAGLADRGETISFLVGLLTGDEAEPGSHFWSGVANSLCDLCPDEVMDAVRDAYDRGLINPRDISLQDFAHTIDAGPESAMDQLRGEVSWRLPEDIDGMLRFCESDFLPSAAPTENRQLDKKKKIEKKAKKKMAKKSRRKNR